MLKDEIETQSQIGKTEEIVNELNRCEIEIRMLKDEIETQSQIGMTVEIVNDLNKIR